MRNFNHLTPEQIDQEIERLQKQLEVAEQSVEDQISDLYQQNWTSYKNRLKSNLVSEIEIISNTLKPKTAFKVVCEKYFGEEFTNQMLGCFNICNKSNNWRILHRVYSHMNPDHDRGMVSFFATMYRRNVLKEKNIYLTNVDKSRYQEVLADFEQTQIFN